MPNAAPGPKSVSGLSGKLDSNLIPAIDLTGRGGRPHLPELVDCQAAREIVPSVYDDGQSVEGDRKLHVLSAGLIRHCWLSALLIRPGSVGNIELARTEFLEATASAGLLHADSNVLVGLLKSVGHDFRHRHERARAVYSHASTQSTA